MITYFSKHKNIFITFFVLVFLFYGNSLKNKYALDDDYVTVTNLPEKGKNFLPNHKLVSKGFGGIVGIWKSRYAHDSEASFDYRPFTTTTFAIEYAIFGQNHFISHLINILLYFFSAWLLFCCLLKLFEEKDYSFPLAFFCALIFIIHPVHSEVVNNLKCRDELLAFFFSLSALWYSIDAYEKPHFKTILLIILLLLLGAFSKKTTVIFSAVIPLCLVFFRKINLKKFAFILITFALIGIIVFIIKKNFITEDLVRHFYHFENPLYTDKVSFFHKIIIGIKTFGFYVQFLLFPYPFRSYYGTNTFDLSADLNIYFFITVSFFALCGFYIYKYKHKLLLFAMLLFSGSIAPFTNISTPAPGVLGERFAYFSTMGFCLILAIIISKYIKLIEYKSISQFFSKPLLYLLPLILICMVYSWNRNSNWANKLTLFEHDIKHLEKSAKANSLLANEYFELLRTPNLKYPPKIVLQKCINHYSQAVANDSSFFSAYNNAGVVYYSYLKDYKQAKQLFKLAIRHKPIYSQAYENLGNCFNQEKEIAKANWCYKKAYEINPKQYTSYIAAITMFFNNKSYDKSLEIIRIAHVNIPSNYELIAQEANCYLMKGDTLVALKRFEEAYVLNPNQNLAQFLSQKYKETGNPSKAELYKNK